MQTAHTSPPPPRRIAWRHRGDAPFPFDVATGMAMASGWAPDGAVQDQIDDTVLDGVTRARAHMPTGEGSTHCIECGDAISQARRRALPGVHTCIACQSARDDRSAGGRSGRG